MASDMLSMASSGVILAALIGVIAVWAASALLYRMAAEKDRLWQRYEQIKADMAHQEQLRLRRQERARKTVVEARQAQLGDEPLDEADLPEVPAVGR